MAATIILISINLCMFATQKKFINSGAYQFESKEPQERGAGEFWKLISYPSLRDRFFLQPAPFFFNQILFKMQKSKRDLSAAEVRISYKPLKTGRTITNVQESYCLFRDIWDDELFTVQEQFYAVFLNLRGEVMCWRLLNTGTMSRTQIDVRLLAAMAIKTLACSVIVAHNHPSGGVNPSTEDTKTTKIIKDGLALFDIMLLDHLILGGEVYYSFLNSGKL